ncbi:MAG: aspartate aminotransferase family protein [Rhodothermales bacterium]
MTNPEELTDSFAEHIAWTSDHPLKLVVDRAEGPYIYLADGRRIVDFISGIAVSSLGHGHPKVVEAVTEQAKRHMHVMVFGEFIQEPQVRLAEMLAKNLPPSLQVVYFTNSGTEANEGALKLAKKSTGRRKIIAFEGSFHGDTHGSLSVTGRSVYREPFAPLLSGVHFLPFDDPAALDAIDDQTACVITEPIQGEGGVNVPSEGWMKALRSRCSEAGALLIFDEVQTGFGRTGTLFCFDGFGIVPDILTLAKALGGGMPLGAFISSAEIFRTLRHDPPLSHVTTCGGHPVSCAAARAALAVLLEEGLPERAREIEKRIRARLRHPLIAEVRGRGAMLGLRLRDSVVTARVVSHCLDRNVLLGWTLHSDRLVRIAPPLNIPWDVLEAACEVILGALEWAAKHDAEKT